MNNHRLPKPREISYLILPRAPSFPAASILRQVPHRGNLRRTLLFQQTPRRWGPFPRGPWGQTPGPTRSNRLRAYLPAAAARASINCLLIGAPEFIGGVLFHPALRVLPTNCAIEPYIPADVALDTRDDSPLSTATNATLYGGYLVPTNTGSMIEVLRNKGPSGNFVANVRPRRERAFRVKC
jgi:hypothetical protein